MSNNNINVFDDMLAVTRNAIQQKKNFVIVEYYKDDKKIQCVIAYNKPPHIYSYSIYQDEHLEDFLLPANSIPVDSRLMQYESQQEFERLAIPILNLPNRNGWIRTTVGFAD